MIVVAPKTLVAAPQFWVVAPEVLVVAPEMLMGRHEAPKMLEMTPELQNLLRFNVYKVHIYIR